MSVPERPHADGASVTLTDSTPVLVTRPINPLANTDSLPVFGDDYWHLTAALFEAHAVPQGLNFKDVPAQYKRIAKIYCWLLINYEQLPDVLRERMLTRFSIATIIRNFRHLKHFFRWLALRISSSLPALTEEDFDEFLAYIRNAPWTMPVRVDCVAAVQLFWALRHQLPLEGRLSIAPWDGEKPSDVLGIVQYSPTENLTHRIPERVMQPLLIWALRFTEDFAQDIIAAHSEFQRLCNRNVRGRRTGLSPVLGNHGRAGRNLRQELRTLFDEYEASGRPLPGRRDETGQLYLNLSQLARVLDCQRNSLEGHTAWLTEEISRRALDLVDGAPLHNQVTGLIDGVPWRSTSITYSEAVAMARHLSTAACIIIAYLSGMRPGEVLNLERGCAVHDSATGLDYVHGRKFKGARGSDGAKLPEGEVRRIPWTVIPVVTQAITVLESLHSRRLLFPSCLEINGRVLRGNGEMARNAALMNRYLRQFITWVNTYCDDHGRVDCIPPDPDGVPIHLSRFRRTLAWFIWHRPRGAVAAAMQYGHVRVSITQGYAGSADSGFPDESAFEELLAHLQQATEDQRLLEEGERVSGPASGPYRERTGRASKHFQGRVIPTGRQARKALDNPDLQIYDGHGIRCVWDRDKALCRLQQNSNDRKRTPDLNNCRPTCQNIAITDRNIVYWRRRLDTLDVESCDPLAPEPRRKRAATLAAQVRALIDAHEAQGSQPSEEHNP